MHTIKIYPPSQLSDRNVSEIEFNIWKEELEVYLSQEDSFQQFLEDGKYETWKKEEESRNGKRITELNAEEGQDANGDALAPDIVERLLKQKNRDLSWAEQAVEEGQTSPGLLTFVQCSHMLL